MDEDAELLALLNGDDVPRAHAGAAEMSTPPPQIRSSAQLPTSPPPPVLDPTMSLSSMAVGVSSSASHEQTALGLVATRRAREDGDDVDGDDASRPRKAARLDVVKETKTGIHISQGTSWLDQLPAIFAQYRFLAIAQLGATSAAKGGGVVEPSSCTIGVVVAKSEPKIGQGKSGSSVFGMLRMWSMRGLSGAATSGEEVAVLVCDAAFQEYYRKLDVGSVVVLSKVELMKPSSSSSSTASHSLTLRCVTLEQLRPLGFAKTLRPCSAVNKSNSEQCKRMVNAAECEYCSFHISELKKVLKSSSATAGGAGHSNKSHGSSVHIAGFGTPVAASSQQRSATTMLHPSSLIPRPVVASTLVAPRNAVGGPAASPLVVTSSSARAAASAMGLNGNPRTSTQPTTVASAAAALLSRTHSGGSLVARTNSAALLTVGQPQRLQSETFIATRGHDVVTTNASLTAATSAESGVAGGTYAGVVRGGAMELTGVDRSALLRGGSAAAAGGGGVSATSRPTLAALGVTPRGRNVLSAAVHRTDEIARSQEVQEAMKLRLATALAGKAPAITHNAGLAATLASAATSVPRAQQHYAPLAGVSRLEEDVVMPAAHHPNRIFAKRSSVVGALAAGMMAAAKMPSIQPSFPSTAAAAALSHAGAAAEAVHSRHDHLRRDTENERLDASARRLMEVDKALSALDQVFEQQVNAVHCLTCRRHFPSRPYSCAKEGHTLQAVQTVKRFFSCDHCQHRVHVLGADVTPSLLMPSCPKCKAVGIWNVVSAAPTNYHVKGLSDNAHDNDHDSRASAAQE